jgi:hypothetical protein
MTLLIELDSDNRASLRRLFDRYPCLHGSVAAVIEGGMGRVFTDAQEEPSVALAVLDFHFLAGDPIHPNALPLFKLLQSGDVVIAPTPAWRHLVAATYPATLAVYRREAFQAEQFDIDQLRLFCQALPIGFALRQVRLEEVTQFATDLDPALIYNFRSHEEFITRGGSAWASYIKARLSPALPRQRLAGGNWRSRFRPTVSFVAAGWPELSQQP